MAQGYVREHWHRELLFEYMQRNKFHKSWLVFSDRFTFDK